MNIQRLRANWTIERGIAVVALALIAATGFVVAERVRYERSEVEQNQLYQNQTLALALEGETLSMLRGVDQTLRLIRHELHEEGLHLDLAALLADGSIDKSLLTNVGVIDRRGMMRFNSQPFGSVDVSDRDYFQTLRSAERDELVIGKPVLGRISGEWTVHVARRITGADGSFDGVVYAGLNTAYLSQFYGTDKLGKGGLMTVVGNDGFARASNAGDRTSFGEDMRESSLFRAQQGSPNGSFVSEGRMDGIRRFVSYRTLKGYPVFVAVGTAVDEAYAEVERRASFYYLFAAVCVLLIMACAFTFRRGIRRQRQAFVAMAEGREQLRATFEQAAVGISHAGMDGRFLRANAEFCRILGYSEEELKRMTFVETTHPTDRGRVEDLKNAVLSRTAPAPALEKRNLRKDGSVVWVSVAVSLVRDGDGNPAYFLTMMQDISARRQAEERFHATFNQAAVGIVLSDLNLRFIDVNPRFCSMLGYRKEELSGCCFTDLTHPDDVAKSLQFRSGLLADKDRPFSAEMEKRYLDKHGAVVWVSIAAALIRDANGEPSYFVTIVRDITEAKRAQEQLVHQAHYDSLTGLPNRSLLYDRLKHAVNQSRRSESPLAVLFVDLDHFKSVNDTLGHDVGDRLLQGVALKIAGAVREGDTVSRVGGDEFVVVANHLSRPEDAGLIADKILEALSVPFAICGHELFINASVGIALYPTDGGDTDTLLRNADAAMFRAKDLGRGNYQFYTVEMNAQAEEKLKLGNDLRRALERNEFELHYQPKVDLRTGAIAGLEALLRWRHPQRGLVSPGLFIPVLEDSGLIVKVGEWVIETACAQLGEWERTGIPAVPIAVNVSAKQFLRGDVAQFIEGALRRAGIMPSLLQVEITESDAMAQPEDTQALLLRLQKLGITSSIDDFGTGYSSLAYLKRFPVSILKIDRAFVSGLPEDLNDCGIARAIITMAHTLGMKVVAEGVETEAQRSYLAQQRCDQMQGYLFSAALPAGECGALLEAMRSAPFGAACATAA